MLSWTQRPTWRTALRYLALASCVSSCVYCANGWVYRDQKPVVLSNPGDRRMQAILRAMRMRKKRFSPTFWAHGTWLQLILFTFWKNWWKSAGHGVFTRHVLTTPDGGEVAVQEYKPSVETVQSALAPDAPLLLVLHTITGTAENELEFAAYAHSRGWRPMVICRRGHFGPLRTPKFNIMGCTQDTERMVAYAKSLYPRAFVGAVGISAGSGQVVSAISVQSRWGAKSEKESSESDRPSGMPESESEFDFETETDTAAAVPPRSLRPRTPVAPAVVTEPPWIQAAVSLCPAYDIDTASAMLDRQSPLLSRYILFGLQRFFLGANEWLLSNSPGYDKARTASGVKEFMEHSVQMAGYDNFQLYMESSCPMSLFRSNDVPCLMLNALDDPLCVRGNIRTDVVNQNQNYAQVFTKKGSHVAYRDGLWGEGCWMHRLAIDFLDAARKQARKVKTKQRRTV